MSKRSRLAHIVLVLLAGLLFLSGCPPESPTVTPKPACAHFTSAEESARAANGSSAVVARNTCVEPAPSAGQKVSVKSYRRQDVSNQWQEAQKLGRVYAMLDIKPEGKTWTPSIKVRFRLDPPAPRDSFRLTIYRWVGSRWTNTNREAVAEHKNDRWAEGEIDHTSLFALIDTTEVPVDQIEAPNVLGLTLDEAVDALEGAGLRVGSVEEVPATADPQQAGTVLWQSIDPGDTVSPGASVDLVVASAVVVVPDLVGLHVDDAIDRLYERGLNPGEITEQEASDVEEGIVLWQSIDPDTTVAPGTSVDLVYASAAVVVPNLVGLNVEEAVDRLHQAGLNEGEIREQDVSDVEAGTVLWQSVDPGTTVAPGVRIDLEYALPSAVVPNLFGLNLDYAIDVLREAGLNHRGTTEQEDVGAKEGTVIGQSIDPGTTVDPGTWIDLVIAVPQQFPPPVADFNAEPREGNCNFTVQFQNLSSNAGSFYWEFGDGGTSTEQNPEHTYNRGEGGRLTFTVRLVVEGPGGFDEETKEDYIVSPGCLG